MDMTFRYRFEAAHRFLGSASPKCRTPHGHTWWVEFSFARRDQDLDADGMLGEFSAVKLWLKQWVEEILDHSYFHHWQDPLVPLMKTEIEDFRGLPFPEDPTTEWIVYLFSRKMRVHLEASKEVAPQRFLELSQVRIEETPTNSLTWRSSPDRALDESLARRLESYQGWWDSPELGSRHLERSRAD